MLLLPCAARHLEDEAYRNEHENGRQEEGDTGDDEKPWNRLTELDLTINLLLNQGSGTWVILPKPAAPELILNRAPRRCAVQSSNEETGYIPKEAWQVLHLHKGDRQAQGRCSKREKEEENKENGIKVQPAAFIHRTIALDSEHDHQRAETDEHLEAREDGNQDIAVKDGWIEIIDQEEEDDQDSNKDEEKAGFPQRKLAFLVRHKCERKEKI